MSRCFLDDPGGSMKVLPREAWYFPCVAGQVLRNPVIVIRPEVPVFSSQIQTVAHIDGF